MPSYPLHPVRLARDAMQTNINELCHELELLGKEIPRRLELQVKLEIAERYVAEDSQVLAEELATAPDTVSGREAVAEAECNLSLSQTRLSECQTDLRLHSLRFQISLENEIMYLAHKRVLEIMELSLVELEERLAELDYKVSIEAHEVRAQLKSYWLSPNKADDYRLIPAQKPRSLAHRLARNRLGKSGFKR